MPDDLDIDPTVIAHMAPHAHAARLLDAVDPDIPDVDRVRVLARAATDEPLATLLGLANLTTAVLTQMAALLGMSTSDILAIHRRALAEAPAAGQEGT